MTLFEPKICVWNDLTSEHLDLIYSASNNENTLSLLADICKVDQSEIKQEILLEFYFHTIQFAKSRELNYAQTSALFTIMKNVHNMCASTPYNNNEAVYAYFQQMLVKHSLQRPPYSIGVFTVNQVQAITEYALNTYFRHFNMYKYAFTPKVRVDISLHYEGAPPTPEPVEPSPVEVEAADEAVLETTPEEVVAEIEPAETDEMRQLREIIQTVMGSELKTLQGKLEKMISEQDSKLAKQVEALEESAGLKAGSKSPGNKKKK